MFVAFSEKLNFTIKCNILTRKIWAFRNCSMTFWILIGRGIIWVLFFCILIIMELISFMIKFVIMYLILSKLYFGHIFLIASSGVLLAAVRGITLFVISFFRLLLFRLRGLIIKLVSIELNHSAIWHLVHGISWRLQDETVLYHIWLNKQSTDLHMSQSNKYYFLLDL